MTSGRRIALALPRPAALAIAGATTSQHLQLSGDLRKFVPAQADDRRATRPDAARAADGLRAVAVRWTRR